MSDRADIPALHARTAGMRSAFDRLFDEIDRAEIDCHDDQDRAGFFRRLYIDLKPYERQLKAFGADLPPEL